MLRNSLFFYLTEYRNLIRHIPFTFKFSLPRRKLLYLENITLYLPSAILITAIVLCRDKTPPPPYSSIELEAPNNAIAGSDRRRLPGSESPRNYPRIRQVTGRLHARPLFKLFSGEQINFAETSR